jgi:signal transduction histidine kinase
MNLLVNARDAMPDGGQISVSTQDVDLDEAYVRQHVGARPGPHVRLRVSDTGHGMDAETQRHIFEPFFTTRDREGHGLDWRWLRHRQAR